MNVYPIFLNNLEGRRCVVIGGNHEAERKVGELLEFSASITLIAPEISPALEEWAAGGQIEWLRRDYRRGDLRDAFLAIVSETNPVATAPIWAEAQDEKVLLNAMDDIPHCTFVAGSVVRRGPFVMSISTSGCAPALSVRIRQQLEKMFDETFGTFVALLGKLRTPMARVYPGSGERKAKWYELVDSDVQALYQSGRVEEAYARMETILGEDVVSELQEEAPAPT